MEEPAGTHRFEAPWDWDEVCARLVSRPGQHHEEDRRSVLVVAVDRLSDPAAVEVVLVDRRDDSQHRERFDLARCAQAYDATSVQQLVAMVHDDLEESVLSVRPTSARPGA